MEVGDWKSTGELGPLYRQIRKLGLEQNIAELDAFGFTILEPGKAAPVAWVEGLRDKLLEVAERRTGVKHDVVTGEHGHLDVQPPFKHQYILYYLLLEDPVFQQAICNPYLLALQTYMLGFDCRLSSCTSFVKWRDEQGYGPTLGLHADTPVTHPLPIGKDTHTGNSAFLLTDYTLDNGALAMVPGSHRYARQPRPGEGADAAIPIEAPMGSLVVWNGNMWHGAFPRKTDGLRLVLTMYFNRWYLYPQEDYRRTVTQEILDANPKRLAVLLGLANPNMWDNVQGPDFAGAAQTMAAAYEEAGLPNPAAPHATRIATDEADLAAG